MRKHGRPISFVHSNTTDWDEASLQSLIETSADALLVTNSAGQILLANSRAAKLVGFTPKQLMRGAVERLIPPRLCEAYSRELHNFFGDTRPRIVAPGQKFFALCADDTEIPVEIRLSPLPAGSELYAINVIRDLRQQQRAEKIRGEETARLALANEHLQLALESSKTVGWDWDIKSGSNHWFGDLKTMFGMGGTAYAGHIDDFRRFIHPDDRDAAKSAVDDARENHRAFNAEFRILWPDGTVRCVVVAGKFLYGPENEPRCMIGMATDITDRKTTEEALGRREAELAEAQRVAQVGSWHWDVKNDIVTWSEELYRIAGRDPSLTAPSYKDHRQLFTPDSWNRLNAAVKSALRSGESYELDLEMVRPDGTTRWIAARGEAVRAAGGLVVTLRGTVQDVTKSKRAETALRESEERFRLVANKAPVMIWMSGIGKLSTYFNQEWLEFTGRSLEQELGNSWAEGIHPEDLEKCLKTYTKAFDRREPFRREYRLRRHDGGYRWILDSAVPRFNADGSFVGYIGSAIDVTERKLAEAAISTVSQKLVEAHEEERTRIARELHDDIGQRLALLAVRLDGLKQARPALAVELGSQVQDLASDIQSLAHSLHPPKLEYLGLGAAAAGFCKELSDRRGVKIEFHSENIPEELPQEISLCLFRVLQEALQNSIKHSGSGRFQVSLSGGTSEIELTVRDSGIGFDPDEAIKGRGLGLTSMQERLRLGGGHLSIDSRPQQGTTIRACVPLRLTMKSAGAAGQLSNNHQTW